MQTPHTQGAGKVEIAAGNPCQYISGYLASNLQPRYYFLF